MSRSLRVGVFALLLSPYGSGEAGVAQDSESLPIGDKTLVAWVVLADLEQRGGSALSIDDVDSHFDGIVFGEIADGRWMAGSDYFRRTQRDQESWPGETAGPDTLVQVAVVYRDREVTIYRDAELYARYPIEQPQRFGPASVMVMGLRHLDAGDRACLAGSIEDSRLYGVALPPERIAELHPNRPSEPPPLAWWHFEDGQVRDVFGRFPETLLLGNARVADGRLHLDGKESFLVAAPSGASRSWLAGSSSENAGRIAAARELRARFLDDPHRPTWHFVAPEGSHMPFDPNGALFWQGRYHLSYIFQDERGHCWAHASSRDLLHWRFHPPALAPGPGDPDRGIFSGNAFVDRDGRAVLLYHGVSAGNCIATSTDVDLGHWSKLASNPIVPIPRPGDPDHGRYESWDPHGWLEGENYYAIFGGNPPTLFRSQNLTDWEFRGPFLSRDLPGVDADEDVSCPDFFRLGDRRVLVCISHKRGCRYYVGRWEGEQFHPQSHARMNWPGGTCFAPESLEDPAGRRILWAWVLDRRSGARIREAGWSGTMTLPRVLSLGDDGMLRIEPAAELEALRTDPHHRGNLLVPADSEIVLEDVHGDSLELDLLVEPGTARRFGVKVRRAPDGSEETLVEVDVEKGCLRIDVTRSTLDSAIDHRTFCMHGGDNPVVTAQEAPLSIDPGQPLRLRIFLDRSILEVFAGNRQCITQRIYPTRTDSRGVALFSVGGAVRVSRLEAWTLAPTNPW